MKTAIEAEVTPEDKAKEIFIQEKTDVEPEGLSPDELSILKTIRARQMLRTEDVMHIDNFATDSIDGYAPVVKRGALTLAYVGARAAPKYRSEMEILHGNAQDAKHMDGSEMLDSDHSVPITAY